jgi:hypothetical protein
MPRFSAGCILAVVALVLLLAGPAQAQGIVVAAGWAPTTISAEGTSETATTGAMFNVAGSVLPFVKIVGDLGYAQRNGGKLYTATTGVRFGIPAVPKVKPFVEGLVGVEYLTGGSGSSTPGVTYGFGGGVDVKPMPVVGLRLQVNYFRARQFGVDFNQVRFGVGISLSSGI